MVGSLLFSGYILLAFYLYKKDKVLWGNVIRYCKETCPLPDKILAFPIFIGVLLCPLVILQCKIKALLRKIGLKRQFETKSSGEDAEYFLEKYYPELMENLKSTTIVLTQEDIHPFINKIVHLFESGFSGQEQFKIEKAIEHLTDEEKLTFSVTNEGKRVPFIIKIEFDDKIEGMYLFTFYSNDFLVEKIDRNIDEFCA